MFQGRASNIIDYAEVSENGILKRDQKTGDAS